MSLAPSIIRVGSEIIGYVSSGPSFSVPGGMSTMDVVQKVSGHRLVNSPFPIKDGMEVRAKVITPRVTAQVIEILPPGTIENSLPVMQPRSREILGEALSSGTPLLSSFVSKDNWWIIVLLGLLLFIPKKGESTR